MINGILSLLIDGVNYKYCLSIIMTDQMTHAPFHNINVTLATGAFLDLKGIFQLLSLLMSCRMNSTDHQDTPHQ